MADTTELSDLVDLIAAALGDKIMHTNGSGDRNRAYVAHVALVVEQRTQTQTARIASVLDAGANILDMHASMLDNLVMDTPHDQTRSDEIAAQARRAAKAFRATFEGGQR